MNDAKSHIIQIALKLFLQRNFKEVTMKEIVEKSGLSKGAFYHYFESKEKLFSEIIDLFYDNIASARNDKTIDVSLYSYYNENLETMNDFSLFQIDKNSSPDDNFFSINFFALIFDALKLFPEFRDRMEEYHKKEMENWVTVINNAKQNKEIKLTIPSEHLAKLFIFSGDGLTLNLTLKGSVENMKQEIRLLWDNIYASVKS
jgi:AcrR family transcriptional regulator